MRVNIYTYTTAKAPRNKVTGYGYVLECMTSKGPATLSHIGTFIDETKNLAWIKTLVEALKKLNKATELTIYTNAFTGSVIDTWLGSWERNNWKNSRGEEVDPIYRELKNLLNPHKVSYGTDFNSYKEWLKRETEKEQARRAAELEKSNV